MEFDYPGGWTLTQETLTNAGATAKLRVPWPGPQFLAPYGATYGLADLIDCMQVRKTPSWPRSWVNVSPLLHCCIPAGMRGPTRIFWANRMPCSPQGRLDEPKNSGRRVGVAIETEIALKVSSGRGGEKIAMSLADRSLRLDYKWFR